MEERNFDGESRHTSLLSDGYLIIPVLSTATTTFARNACLEGLQKSPEYTAELNGLTMKLEVKGKIVEVPWATPWSFGAMGTPTSFHLPIIRQIRLAAYRATVEELKNEFPENIETIQMLFDRFSIRVFPEKIGAESWHRDVIPRDDSIILGGWVNLDDTPQYFNCVPGTHSLDPTEISSEGFVKFNPEEIADFNQRRLRVLIPPGSAVIFFQNIVHEIARVPKGTPPSVRLYIGYSLGKASMGKWINEIRNAIENGVIPILPSGQWPEIVPFAYSRFNSPTANAWESAIFGDNVVNIKSRRDAFGISRHVYAAPVPIQPYSSKEKRMYFPSMLH